MCGIFGIISPGPRPFDVRAYCVLGVENDSRGGDSCGVFIDGLYEYGVNERKLFADFFPTSEILGSVTTATVALGHCRKASVGAVNEANAQPVVIKDGDKVEYVLMHNGTIYNYLQLAAKYIPDVDIEGMTDSQVMARIFYHAGYDALGEYIGAGVFVMADYREGCPMILMFKGKSKPDPESDAKVERPLYYSLSSTELVFSSLKTYLRALWPDRAPKPLPPNILFQLKDSTLNALREYDRTNIIRLKK